MTGACVYSYIASMRDSKRSAPQDPMRLRSAVTDLFIDVFRLNGGLLAAGDALVGDLCRKILDHEGEVPKELLPSGVFGPAHRNTSDTANTAGRPRLCTSKFRPQPTN